MALSEALGSYLLVDLEEGITHEVEVLQCLGLRGWPELIEVTRQAVLIVVADIYIELLPEVVLDIPRSSSSYPAARRSGAWDRPRQKKTRNSPEPPREEAVQ